MVIVSKTKSLHTLAILTLNKKKKLTSCSIVKKSFSASLPVTVTNKKKKRNIKQMTAFLDP